MGNPRRGGKTLRRPEGSKLCLYEEWSVAIWSAQEHRMLCMHAQQKAGVACAIVIAHGTALSPRCCRSFVCSLDRPLLRYA